MKAPGTKNRAAAAINTFAVVLSISKARAASSSAAPLAHKTGPA